MGKFGLKSYNTFEVSLLTYIDLVPLEFTYIDDEMVYT